MSTGVHAIPRWQLIEGDCVEAMRAMPDASVDSICADPPAGISFMNLAFDHDRGGRAQWVAWLTEVMRECLRVLKPGGHMLVWALPRTSHWTATAIDDAGFDVRDCICHVFSSGFPKSLDVGKTIDKAAGAKRDVVRTGDCPNIKSGRLDAGIGNHSRVQIEYTKPATDAAKQWDGFGTALKPAHEMWWLARKPFTVTVAENVQQYGTGALNIDGCRVGIVSEDLSEDSPMIKRGQCCESHESLHVRSAVKSTRRVTEEGSIPIATENAGVLPDDGVSITRSGTSTKSGTFDSNTGTTDSEGTFTNSSTDEFGERLAERYQTDSSCTTSTRSSQTTDSRTSCSSRDPSIQDTTSEISRSTQNQRAKESISGDGKRLTRSTKPSTPTENASAGNVSKPTGRWPSNFLLSHDHAEDEECTPECPVAMLDGQAGPRRNGGQNATSNLASTGYSGGLGNDREPTQFAGDTGMVSRYFPVFYCPKASKADRGEGNTHPTVKNTSLMAWLCRLITPPGGTVLDCFAGSGSTLVAAVREGFHAIGIEREPEYCAIIRRRLGEPEEPRSDTQALPPRPARQLDLFAAAGGSR